MKLVVVGAGIAGSSVARVARAAGHNVTVVADGREHSRAAAALLRRAYHAKRPGEDALFARSLALYRQWGMPVSSGALVTNYRTSSRAARADSDWYLLDPAAPLVPPDVPGHAEPTETGVRVGADRDQLDADAVVWCTGVRSTDALSYSYGVTWTHADPRVLAEPHQLRVHHRAPYKTFIAGVAGGGVRLGSSSAATESKAIEQAQAILTAARDLGIIRSLHGWRPACGIRCKTALPPVPHRHGRHRTLAGLHRTGYALAPALAADLIDTLTWGANPATHHQEEVVAHG